MTNQEILEEYHDLIESRVQEYLKDNSNDINGPLELERLRKIFRKNFIVEFREAEAQEKLAMAKKMLAKGKPIEEIIEFTELTKKQIEKLT